MLLHLLGFKESNKLLPVHKSSLITFMIREDVVDQLIRLSGVLRENMANILHHAK
jgi:hypothetical protein